MFELQHAVIITGQHAMHAERDTVLPYLSACLSVCLSVCPTNAVVSKCMNVSRF